LCLINQSRACLSSFLSSPLALRFVFFFFFFCLFVVSEPKAMTQQQQQRCHNTLIVFQLKIKHELALEIEHSLVHLGARMISAR
jgi:hypothetical protein